MVQVQGLTAGGYSNSPPLESSIYNPEILSAKKAKAILIALKKLPHQ